jgi:hypothetical protein
MLRHYVIYCAIQRSARCKIPLLEEGNLSAVVVPDVFVALGVEQRQRRIYKLWEEGVSPTFVIEVSSRSTRLEDQGTKRGLYAPKSPPATKRRPAPKRLPTRTSACGRNWRVCGGQRLESKRLGDYLRKRQSPNLPISQSPNLPISQSPNLPISQSPNLPISLLLQRTHIALW